MTGAAERFVPLARPAASAEPARLAGLAGLAEPTTSSSVDEPVPVLPPLLPLFPAHGLRRGSLIAIQGSASLLIALLAGASQAGAWCAVVGLPTLGLLAVSQAGVALDRLALVPRPGAEWVSVVAALVDGFDVVAVAPPSRVPDGAAHRLAARARQRGAVLVSYGPVSWPGADLRLSADAGTWHGLGAGHGHLRARRMRVRGEGRGSAARGRHAQLWLPAEGGGVTAAAPAAPVVPIRATAAAAVTEHSDPPPESAAGGQVAALLKIPGVALGTAFSPGTR